MNIDQLIVTVYRKLLAGTVLYIIILTSLSELEINAVNQEGNQKIFNGGGFNFSKTN